MADEEIITVRIPELPVAPDPLAPDDQMVIWQAGNNITCKIPLSVIHDYIATGGGGGSSPATSSLGSTFLHIVTAGEAGGTTVSIPSLAGQEFTLSRDGIPLELGDDTTPEEYSILDAGGFKITIPGDVLVVGQRFFGQVYTLIAGPAPSGGGGSLVTGKFQVVTNLPMTVADHIGKLMQIRAGITAPVIVTLPDLTDIPANTIIPFEAAITNAYQSTIRTTGGQNIYFNNQSATEVYIGPGENLWLYRDTDGFYMLTDYPDVGKINAVYKVGIDELLCDGSLVDRLKYPRLFAWVKTLGPSYVSDTLRNQASQTLSGRTVLKPYRGCFGQGDGITNFQLPDLMNVSIRGLKNDGGGDSERYYNHGGGFQLNEVLAHGHTPADDGNGTNYGLLPTSTPGQAKTPQGADATNGEPNVINQPKAMVSYGGTETRMDNVGLLMAIKC